MKRSKRYQAAIKTLDKEKAYGLEEGVKIIKSAAAVKFDETVDMAIRLGVDPKHAD
jgi:large subunit ribosomal protein L1